MAENLDAINRQQHQMHVMLTGTFKLNVQVTQHSLRMVEAWVFLRARYVFGCNDDLLRLPNWIVGVSLVNSGLLLTTCSRSAKSATASHRHYCSQISMQLASSEETCVNMMAWVLKVQTFMALKSTEEEEDWVLVWSHECWTESSALPWTIRR